MNTSQNRRRKRIPLHYQRKGSLNQSHSILGKKKQSFGELSKNNHSLALALQEARIELARKDELLLQSNNQLLHRNQQLNNFQLLGTRVEQAISTLEGALLDFKEALKETFDKTGQPVNDDIGPEQCINKTTEEQHISADVYKDNLLDPCNEQTFPKILEVQKAPKDTLCSKDYSRNGLRSIETIFETLENVDSFPKAPKVKLSKIPTLNVPLPKSALKQHNTKASTSKKELLKQISKNEPSNLKSNLKVKYFNMTRRQTFVVKSAAQNNHEFDMQHGLEPEVDKFVPEIVLDNAGNQNKVLNETKGFKIPSQEDKRKTFVISSIAEKTPELHLNKKLNKKPSCVSELLQTSSQERELSSKTPSSSELLKRCSEFKENDTKKVSKEKAFVFPSGNEKEKCNFSGRELKTEVTESNLISVSVASSIQEPVIANNGKANQLPAKAQPSMPTLPIEHSTTQSSDQLLVENMQPFDCFFEFPKVKGPNKLIKRRQSPRLKVTNIAGKKKADFLTQQEKENSITIMSSEQMHHLSYDKTIQEVLMQQPEANNPEKDAQMLEIEKSPICLLEALPLQQDSLLLNGELLGSSHKDANNASRKTFDSFIEINKELDMLLNKPATVTPPYRGQLRNREKKDRYKFSSKMSFERRQNTKNSRKSLSSCKNFSAEEYSVSCEKTELNFVKNDKVQNTKSDNNASFQRIEDLEEVEELRGHSTKENDMLNANEVVPSKSNHKTSQVRATEARQETPENQLDNNSTENAENRINDGKNLLSDGSFALVNFVHGNEELSSIQHFLLHSPERGDDQLGKKMTSKERRKTKVKPTKKNNKKVAIDDLLKVSNDKTTQQQESMEAQALVESPTEICRNLQPDFGVDGPDEKCELQISERIGLPDIKPKLEKIQSQEMLTNDAVNNESPTEICENLQPDFGVDGPDEKCEELSGMQHFLLYSPERTDAQTAKKMISKERRKTKVKPSKKNNKKVSIDDLLKVSNDNTAQQQESREAQALVESPTAICGNLQPDFGVDGPDEKCELQISEQIGLPDIKPKLEKIQSQEMLTNDAVNNENHNCDLNYPMFKHDSTRPKETKGKRRSSLSVMKGSKSKKVKSEVKCKNVEESQKFQILSELFKTEVQSNDLISENLKPLQSPANVLKVECEIKCNAEKVISKVSPQSQNEKQVYQTPREKKNHSFSLPNKSLRLSPCVVDLVEEIIECDVDSKQSNQKDSMPVKKKRVKAEKPKGNSKVSKENARPRSRKTLVKDEIITVADVHEPPCTTMNSGKVSLAHLQPSVVLTDFLVNSNLLNGKTALKKDKKNSVAHKLPVPSNDKENSTCNVIPEAVETRNVMSRRMRKPVNYKEPSIVKKIRRT